MASKNFKRTVKAVDKNFKKYTQAMEADIQKLITSMLDAIEEKIEALRKMLKLKVCIKNVRHAVGFEHMAAMEDSSINPTINNTSNEEKKYSDSLEDFSSIIYEVDKNSLPLEENAEADDKMTKTLKMLDDFIDIESLCSALNHQTSALQKDDLLEEPLKLLDKYIYLLLDAEKQKQTEETKDIEKIGDAASQFSFTDNAIKSGPLKESVVCLQKAEYESILNILNMVLRSYKKQEELTKINKIVEKAKTEILIGSSLDQSDGRKIVSASAWQQKENHLGEKKTRSRI